MEDMMSTKKYERKFGEIPEWAKKGDITLENYDLRMEEYGVRAGWKDNWPMLSRIENIPSTADAGEWDLYFRDILGGFPPTYKLYRDGVIKALNLPERHPGAFDPRFYKLKDASLEPSEPPIDVTWQEVLLLDNAEPLEHRQKVTARIRKELLESFASNRLEPYNVFVPTFAPQYAAMVARGGRPGVSLEDKTRHGVWVPRSWLAEEAPKPAGVGWKRFDDDLLRAMYGRGNGQTQA
jgi:hypothetical protein